MTLEERIHEAVRPWIDVYFGPNGFVEVWEERPWVAAILAAIQENESE